MKTPQEILDLSKELDEKSLLRDWHFIEIKGVLGFKLSDDKNTIRISIAEDDEANPHFYYRFNKTELELFINFIRHIANSSLYDLRKIHELMET